MKDCAPISLSIKQAVQMTDIGRTRLYAAIKSGALHVSKCGSRTLIRYEDLKRFVDGLPSTRNEGGKSV